MELTWMQLLVLILASFRLTHLIVYDKITAFIRKPFIETVSEVDENGQTNEVMKVRGEGIRYWIGSLLSCYWCTGIWSSILIVLIYMYLPVFYPLLLILAVAGAAAIIESRIP